MAAHVEFHNMEHLNAAAEDGRPIFVMLGHYGNWEWVPSITMSSSKRLTAGQIYRRQHDGVIDNAMLTLRSRFGSVSIPQDKAFRNILRRTNAGEQLLIGFIADQRPNSANLNHWTEFLHQDTAYAPGCEEIGQRVNAHYYYLDIEKTRRGHYSMTLCPIIPDSDLVGEKYPYTLQFMRMFQRTIERQPAYWLWSHKRWSIKRQQPEN
jgi:KDO2-lipid IV(A) lauroyltransferase